MLTPRPGPIAIAIGAVVILGLFLASALHYQPGQATKYGSKLFGDHSHSNSGNEALDSSWNETLGVSSS